MLVHVPPRTCAQVLAKRKRADQCISMQFNVLTAFPTRETKYRKVLLPIQGLFLGEADNRDRIILANASSQLSSVPYVAPIITTRTAPSSVSSRGSSSTIVAPAPAVVGPAGARSPTGDLADAFSAASISNAIIDDDMVDNIGGDTDEEYDDGYDPFQISDAVAAKMCLVCGYARDDPAIDHSECTVKPGRG